MFAFSFQMTFDKVSNISPNCKNILAGPNPFFPSLLESAGNLGATFP